MNRECRYLLSVGKGIGMTFSLVLAGMALAQNTAVEDRTSCSGYQ